MKKLITVCLLLVATFIVKAQESFKLNTYEENGKVGLLDENGRKITAAKYDKYWGEHKINFSPVFYRGLCSVGINDLMGFIDKTGKEVIPLEFSMVGDFTVEELAVVQKDGKWGVINKKGKKIVPIIYDKVCDFENGKALVIKGRSVYYVDVKGQEIDSKYSLMSDYEEDKFLVIQNSKGQYGFLHGTFILNNFYDKIDLRGKDFFKVFLRGKIGVINKYAKEIIPPIYDEFNGFDGKYFYLRKIGKGDRYKVGIINTEGKVISPFVYEFVSKFSEGLSTVVLDHTFGYNLEGKDERYGYIDENNKEAIPRIYDYAADFKNGKAKVRIGDREFYIDKTGKEVKL